MSASLFTYLLSKLGDLIYVGSVQFLCLYGSFRSSGFLSQPKCMQIRLTGYSKLTIGVIVYLCVSPTIFWQPAQAVTHLSAVTVTSV